MGLMINGQIVNGFKINSSDVNGMAKNGEVIWRKSVTPVEAHYLPFQSDTQFTLQTGNNTKTWDGVLEYSIDATIWSEWDGTSISSSTDGLLYLRGTGNTVITPRSSFSFDNASNLKALGNIEYLLDWETVKNGEHPVMSNNCYNGMFWDCSSLTIPPELPATTLADSCYSSMFRFCTSLTIPPELPATTLTSLCYEKMFNDCSSLTIPPELPATTLAPYCYSAMFFNCHSLVTAPELPATTLALRCYFHMFTYCTSLTTPPRLLATTLSTSCYECMFYVCSSLTTLPELPATTLEPRCYNTMFIGCENIKMSRTQSSEYKYEWRIPATGEILNESDGWNTDMLLGVGGTFTGNPQINTTYYTNNPSVTATPAPMNMSRVAIFGIEPNAVDDEENIKILNELGVEQI